MNTKKERLSASSPISRLVSQVSSLRRYSYRACSVEKPHVKLSMNTSIHRGRQTKDKKGKIRKLWQAAFGPPDIWYHAYALQLPFARGRFSFTACIFCHFEHLLLQSNYCIGVRAILWWKPELRGWGHSTGLSNNCTEFWRMCACHCYGRNVRKLKNLRSDSTGIYWEDYRKSVFKLWNSFNCTSMSINLQSSP
jgi:hypothetical protein